MHFFSSPSYFLLKKNIFFFVFFFFLFFSFSLETHACRTPSTLKGNELTKTECEDFGGSCSGCGSGQIKLGTCTGFFGGGACGIGEEKYKKLIEEGKLPPDPFYEKPPEGSTECSKVPGAQCNQNCTSVSNGYSIGKCDNGPPIVYCCKPGASSESSVNASFDYTPLEPIPGTEGIDTSTLKGFLEGLFLFVLWSAGIATLFMLVIGGFWYMTSAGNTSRVTEAKNIIANALWGLVIVLITWLVLYVINPDLVRIDLSSLEALFIEGKVYHSYPQKKGVVGPGGSGTCGKATTSGNCSISNMQQCSAWNPEAASRVCLFESSGGNAFAESGSDKCADGSSFSFGLFQINIIANGEKLNGCDPNQAFKKYDGSPLGSSRGNNGGVLEYCTNSKGIRYVCKWNCKVVDTNMYNICKQSAFDINQNISVACSLYRSGGWKHWPVTKKICNL